MTFAMSSARSSDIAQQVGTLSSTDFEITISDSVVPEALPRANATFTPRASRRSRHLPTLVARRICGTIEPEMLGAQYRGCGREGERPLDGIAQFAYVARPGVGHERGNRVGCKHGGSPAGHSWFMKCRASTAMSSLRSRSGGTKNRDDLQAVSTSPRETCAGSFVDPSPHAAT